MGKLFGRQRERTHKKPAHKKERRVWKLHEAKTKFSKLVDEVIEDGYHTITRNGEPVVVVISQAEFEEYKKPKTTLLEFFKKAPHPEIELKIDRDKNDSGREIDL